MGHGAWGIGNEVTTVLGHRKETRPDGLTNLSVTIQTRLGINSEANSQSRLKTTKQSL